MTLTPAERRQAAFAISEFSKYDSFLIAAFAEAKEIAHAGQTPSPKTADAALRSAWSFVPGESSEAVYSSEQISRAEAVLTLLTELGNRDHRHKESDALDREIINALADQYNRDAGINASAVAKRINRSHTTVDNRRTAWCSRVLAKLRAEWPNFFGEPYDQHIADAKAAGAKTLTDIAGYLTARSIPTPRGNGHQWFAKQVSRLAA
jgi:hypothetical protein